MNIYIYIHMSMYNYISAALHWEMGRGSKPILTDHLWGSSCTARSVDIEPSPWCTTQGWPMTCPGSQHPGPQRRDPGDV